MSKKKEYKCSFCEKTFKKKSNRDKHEKLYCKSNPEKIEEKKTIEDKIDKIIEDEGVVEIVVEIEDVEKIVLEDEKDVLEDKYTLNELFLIQFFKGFNPERVFINKNQGTLLDPIYSEYGMKRSGDCAGEYTRMYIYLYYKMLDLIKR